MAKVFVSYSRKDIEFAKRLTNELKKSDLDFWIDWAGIPPTVDWRREIEKGIEEADIFLFLISPDSAKSKICGQEIDTAVKNGKRIIPIVVREIEWQDTPTQLGHLNYIFFSRDDDFDTALKRLITAIQTDYEWAATHRRLQVKALEWERNHKENSYLLRGKDLQDAESQLATNTSKDPHPTDLQREYVFESRKSTDKQRKLTTGISIAGVIALAALAIYGFVQAGRATNNAIESQKNAATAQAASTLAFDNAATAQANEQLANERAQISRSGELVAQSLEMRDDDFQLSLLLAMEAFHTWDTVRSRGNLLDATNTNPQLIQFIPEHTDYEYIIGFNQGGQSLITRSGDPLITLWDNTITLWDLQTHQSIRQHLSGPPVKPVGSSPDGKILSSVSDDNTIILWDMKTLQPIPPPLVGHTDPVRKVIFSPDGRTLASGDSHGTVILWNVETHQSIGQQLMQRPNDENNFCGVSAIPSTCDINDFSFSPDGKTMVSAGEDHRMIWWDVETQQVIDQISMGNLNTVSSLAISSDGKMLVSGDIHGKIILWDMETHQPIGQPLTEYLGIVNSLVFSPNGRTLAATNSKTVVLWDMETRQPIHEPLIGHKGWVTKIIFTPDGKTLATEGSDGAIVLWDVETHQPIGHSLLGHTDGVTSITFSPDGKTLASGSTDNTVIVWDMKSRQPVGQPFVGTDDVTSVALSPDGKTLASGSADSSIILWDIETHAPIGQPLAVHKYAINGITFSPNGKKLAAGNGDNTITIWDVATHEALTQLIAKDTDSVNSITFSPDGKTLAAGCSDGTVILWDMETDQTLGQRLKGHTRDVHRLTFSPDSKILASASEDNTIVLWDMETRQPIGQPIIGHGISLYSSLAFSPDSKILAEGGEDVSLWDVETHQQIGQPLAGHKNWIDSVAFSPDGKILATGSLDNMIILWSASPQFWIEYSCQRVGRNFTRAEWEKYGFTEPHRKTCDQWPLASDIATSPTVTP